VEGSIDGADDDVGIAEGRDEVVGNEDDVGIDETDGAADGTRFGSTEYRSCLDHNIDRKEPIH